MRTQGGVEDFVEESLWAVSRSEVEDSSTSEGGVFVRDPPKRTSAGRPALYRPWVDERNRARLGRHTRRAPV